MSWFENLKRSVGSAITQNPVVKSITQSPPVRMAGRALGSTYVKPTMGAGPFLGGMVVSSFLPEENPVRKLVDAGLYLGGGPLNISLGLSGSSPPSIR